jgi:hypothetical protein
MSIHHHHTRGKHRPLLACLSGSFGLLLVILASVAAPADAAKQHLPGTPASFGEEGSGPGQLREPTAVAVNQESGLSEGAGNVYVDDRGNDRVERFSSTGAYLGQFNGGGEYEVEGKKETSAAAPTGPFNEPSAVAVDNNPLNTTSGDVYVADKENHVIDRFSALGAYEAQIMGRCEKPEAPPCTGSSLITFARIIGIAVDSSGTLWVYEGKEGEGWVTELTSNGATLKSFLTGEGAALSGGIAVGGGNVFVGNSTTVSRFEAATGHLITRFNTQVTAGEGVRALALDPNTADLLLDDNERRSESESVVVVHGPFGEPYLTPIETFPAQPLTKSSGIAVGTDDTAYVTESTSDKVLRYEYFQPPISEAATVTESAVTLHGIAYPEGETITACTFEYGAAAGEYTSSTACSPAAPISGSQPVTVQATLTGLAPRTTYRYRLVSTSSKEKPSADDTFFTSTRPLVEEETLGVAGGDEAVVSASVDAAGLSTAYKVEYGAGTAYGTATPETQLGAPETPSNITVRIPGITGGEEYHFRVTAMNSFGTSSGAEIGFVVPTATGPATTTLPDHRAYERVSNSPVFGELILPTAPLGTGEFAAEMTDRPFQVATNGEAVAYVGEPSASGGNGGIGNGDGTEWLATRSSTGWQSSDITAVKSNSSSMYQGFSSDLSSGIEINEAPLAPGAVEGCDNLYDYTTASASYRALTTAAQTPGRCGSSHYAGATPTLSQVLISSEAALTPGSEPAEEGEFGHSTSFYEEGCVQDCNLYDAAGGVLRQVNVLPDGTQVPNAAFGGPSLSDNPPDFGDDISEDGLHAFWTDMQSGSDENHLYMRVNPAAPESPHGARGECTVAADACSVPVSEGSAQYWGATPNGRYVFYIEAGELWRFESDTMTRELVVGKGMHGENAGVQGVLGINQTGGDGVYVYIVAEAALTPGADPVVCRTAAEGSREREQEEEGFLPAGRGCNLYLLHNGEAPKLITTLSPEDNGVFATESEAYSRSGDWAPDLGSRTSELAPDGESLLFESRLSLTGYDNRDTQSIGTTRVLGENEAYVYSTNDEQLTCVSCDPTGAEPAAETEFTLLPVSENDTHSAHLMADDGNRVFFVSLEALTPQDSNGYQDVYEWEREGTGTCVPATPAHQDHGCVSLLSGGGSADDSYLVEADAEGNNVFLITREQLVPEDQDDKRDLYDVRVDGGFPESSLACTGTGCQGVPPAAPSFATPASVTFSGAANYPPALAAKKAKTAAQIRAEDLKRALQACRAKRDKHRRKGCEAEAKRRYGPPQHKSEASRSSKRVAQSGTKSSKGTHR